MKEKKGSGGIAPYVLKTSALYTEKWPPSPPGGFSHGGIARIIEEEAGCTTESSGCLGDEERLLLLLAFDTHVAVQKF